jgi:hypothetical protein
MKTIKLIPLLILLNLTIQGYSQFNFQRSWGTYFGDDRFHLSDSKIDRDGNLYIIGTIDGSDITNLPVFTNSSSYQLNYGGGNTDGFIVKFNPSGNMVWGTFFGGESAEKMGGIDIDSQNNLYIVGSTNSLTNIATPNSFQENNAGSGDYFISKLTSSGAIIWSTYYGGSGNDFDTFNSLDESRTKIAFDGSSNLYITGQTGSATLGTSNVFQENKGTSNYMISKFDINGNRIWTTYYGVDTSIKSLVANSNSVYVSGINVDCPPNHSYNTYYGTVGSHQPTPGSCKDVFLSKFNSLGQREWSTYYGGNNLEDTNFNSISLHNDKVLLAGRALNYTINEISTPSAYQPNCNNYGASNFIAQFSENGVREWGTYNGNYTNTNQPGSFPSNVVSDNTGNYYNFGSTAIPSDITTVGAYKEQKTDIYTQDGFVCKFDTNGNKIWGTYYGGESDEYNVRFHPYSNSFYMVGASNSNTGIATSNGYQPAKQVFDLVNNTQQSAFNIFIAHFEPKPLSTESFDNTTISIYPNPSKGNFTISLKNNTLENTKLEMFDILGKKIRQENLTNNETIINTNDLSKGVYFAKISNKDNMFYNSKIVVE